MADPERAARVLPDAPNGDFLRTDARVAGRNGLTATGVHYAGEQRFFAPDGVTFRRRSSAHVAGFTVARLLSRSALASAPALRKLVPGGVK